MTHPALARVPASIRRIAAFVVAGVVVYALLLAVGVVLFPAASSAPTYALSSVAAAGIAAFYLVYLRGFARLRDLLR